jgi:hypothetical protein
VYFLHVGQVEWLVVIAHIQQTEKSASDSLTPSKSQAASGTCDLDI